MVERELLITVVLPLAGIFGIVRKNLRAWLFMRGLGANDVSRGMAV